MADVALLRRRARRAPGEPVDKFRAAAVNRAIRELDTAVARLNAMAAPLLDPKHQEGGNGAQRPARG